MDLKGDMIAYLNANFDLGGSGGGVGKGGNERGGIMHLIYAGGDCLYARSLQWKKNK